jgi:hypothetical protein
MMLGFHTHRLFLRDVTDLSFTLKIAVQNGLIILSFPKSGHQSLRGYMTRHFPRFQG